MTGLVIYTCGVLALFACTAVAAFVADRWSLHVERVGIERAVDERMATPLEPARFDLTGEVPTVVVDVEPHWTETAAPDGTRIGTRWPERQSPYLFAQLDNEPIRWTNPAPSRHAGNGLAGGALTYEGHHRAAEATPYRSRQAKHREVVNA
jgi:hypothetical protein